MFKNGCPMCGYSAPPPPKQPKIRQKKPKKVREHHVAEPLPFWTYAAAFIALFAAILLLSHLITK
jgi:hypothetical protein